VVAILIDPPAFRHRGHRWSHLASDASYEELHAFARKLGMGKDRFQADHYDIPESMYQRAISLGATAVSSRELVRRLIDAKLRKSHSFARRSRSSW
jgi:hypothetical protein